MANLASGNISCTASAITWAAECRIRWSGEYCIEFSNSASADIDFPPFGVTDKAIVRAKLHHGRRKRPHPSSPQLPPLRDQANEKPFHPPMGRKGFELPWFHPDSAS